MNKKIDTKDIVVAGLGIAVVFIATMFIKIPNAYGGYLNLGDGFILMFSSLLNPFLSFLVGGLGSSLADIAGGYGAFALPTFIIKGLEGCIVSILMKQYSRNNQKKIQIIAYTLGSMIMISGYFIAEWFMTGSQYVAAAEIFGNLLQAVFGLIIAFVVFPIIEKIYTHI